MNVASSTYRRFTKELLQKNSEQTTFGNHNVIQSESDSGYQSSSSVEPLNKPVAIYNAKRTLQMHQFAPESHEVNTSFKPESQPIVSPKFHLNAHSNRLSRLKIDASSKFVPSFNENTAKPESQSSATAEAQVLDETLSESTIQTSQENTNSEEEQSFKECFESETFTSATSSPSHAHEVISESGTVFTEDHKSDTLCSVSDSSAIDFIEDSAQVDAATPKVKVAPKVKTTYIRFDSRRLMNPISLPAVHPAAQPRSSIGPLASKTDKKKSPNDLFEREQLEDNITRQEPFAFNSSCRGSSSIISNQALFFSSTDLASGAGIASAPTSASVSTSPAFKPSTGPFKNEKLGPGPDSLGGFNYVESRQNTRRAKRNANEKKRQERELLIADFNSKLSGEDIMGAFDALFKLSFNGAQDWIKANLSSSLGTVSNPLRFALKLVEFWTMRSNQRHSPSHERALSWLLNPLSSIVLELGERLHLSLSEEDASYMREKVIVLGPSLSPRIWANLINLLELCISEELLIQKARELLTNVGRLDDLYFFVKELSLQTLLPFDELFVPLIRTKHYAWASELALGNPILLHQLVMAVLPVDAKQSLRIILDCSMNLDAYSTIEVAAKLPELSALMHQGLLLEFVELICGSNYSLQVEISKSALTSGHTIEFGKLCSLFGITLRDLDIDESFEIIENCSICQQNEIATETLDKKFLELSVPVIFDPSDCDLEYFLLSSSLVAFDLEFRPKFCQFCRADSLKAATLQLATPNCCLVLDLMSPLGENRLEILRSVFENPDILKLGFGIENDLQLLATTLTDSYFQKACSVLDLQKVVAKLARVESARRVADIGLSQACELVLDIQLDKAEQISNWEHRPLRESQIQYAALDSYCLILLSENLVDSCVITESLCTSDDCSSIQDDFSILLSMTENEININI